MHCHDEDRAGPMAALARRARWLFIVGLVALACSARGAGSGGEAPAPTPTPVSPLAEAAIMADVRWLCDPARAGRGSWSAEAQATATWLGEQLRAAGYTVSTQAVGEQVNVIGLRRGGPRAVVVSAHYDHLGVVDGVVYPGADDNASGVAVALAVARDLAARPAATAQTPSPPGIAHGGRLTPPASATVVIAFFAAEEVGLIGSRAYAEHPTWPLADTIAVLNLDMVGRNFFEAAIGRPAALGAVGLEDDPRLADAAEAAAHDAGLALITASPALLTAVGEDHRSDDWSLRRPGLAAIHFSTGLHDDYHRPSDTVDRLVPAQLERVARFLRDLVDRCSGLAP
jgi:Zn-dependent M28 family amino/carboxypeptidase